MKFQSTFWLIGALSLFAATACASNDLVIRDFECATLGHWTELEPAFWEEELDSGVQSGCCVINYNNHSGFWLVCRVFFWDRSGFGGHGVEGGAADLEQFTDFFDAAAMVFAKVFSQLHFLGIEFTQSPPLRPLARAA